MKPLPTLLGTLLGATLAVAAPTAFAHDTWFEPLPGAAAAAAPRAAARGETLLALGTGNEYPLQDSAIGAEYLVRQGCRTAAAAAVKLQPLRNTPTSLVLRAPRGARSCWAQLTPFEVELAADKVPVYLKDIQASAEVRSAWAAMQARGLPWRERYTKHARIELGAAGGGPTNLASNLASNAPAELPPVMDLDIRLLDAATGPLRVGDTLHAQVLRDGLPLAGQAIELRSEGSRIGIWRRTDAEGRLAVTLPLAGRWVLRGVDLRLSASEPDHWDSRFVTLAFEVAAPASPQAAPAGGTEGQRDGQSGAAAALIRTARTSD